MGALGVGQIGRLGRRYKELSGTLGIRHVQERRGVPLFSFPVVYSNFITALQAEGIID